jgi:hypothetical protein
LTGFAGIAVAISANGLAGLATSTSRIPSLSVFAAAHLTLSLFILSGLQYLFRLPVEPRANWIFRVYEPGHSVDLLSGGERFMLFGGVLPVTLLSLAIDLLTLDLRRAILLTLLALFPALLLVEGLLFSWYRIPFTSLYLPARKMITETLIKYGLGVVLYISILSTLLSWCVDNVARWLPAMAFMLLAYLKLRAMRLDTQRVGRIDFEELPETVVQTLAIERD